MSTQQEIAAVGNSLIKKRFKYVLQTSENIKELKYAPQGWNEGELTFIRDKEFKGILTQFSTNELTFVKDGKDFIVSVYESYGIDYVITVYIYLQNNSTFQYESYFTGKIDLASYNVDSIGVTVKISNVGFQELILNRKSLKVDFTNTKFIGGGENSMPVLSNVWNYVTIPEYLATANGDWNLTDTLSNITVGYKYFHVPMALTFSEYEASEDFNQTMSLFSYPPTEKFFVSGSNRTVTLDFNITVNLTSQSTPGTFSLNLYLVKNGTIIQTFTPTTTTSSGITTVFTFVVNQSLAMLTGDEFSLIGYSNGDILYYIYVHNSSLSFIETLGTTLTAIDVPMYYVYECFVRNLQLITGNQAPFYSEFLGRTDSETETYASDGDGALTSITNGKYIRGFSPTLNGFNLSLSDLFNSINAINNIGLGFETIGGLEKLRVEDEKYFFDISINPDYATDGKYWKVNQILDLSEHVTSEILSKQVDADLYSNEIEVGYNNYEYENVQGLKEFNTKSNWAIPVESVENKLSLISQIRGDTQGCNKLRAKPFGTYPTEDVGGDNDNFLFDVKRGGTYDFIVKTDEDFSNVSGGVDPSQCYNLNYSPARNLRRHSHRVRSMQIQESKELLWLKSNKNTALVTEKTGETAITENEDILIDNLVVGYCKPESYNFEAPVDAAIITAIKTNPYGVIKVGVDMYGWIDEIQTNDKTVKGQFKLLKVDLNNVKVID
ncbi:MAG: hypothetical protein HN347_01245 [Bacteroidetes bacterium]|nr:hypothetical protein [Bacteroidota bacterium]